MDITITDPQKADTFAGLFQHLQQFTTTVNIMFNQERMYIQTMDSAHVSIIEMFLPCSWFDIYNFTGDTPVNIGINTIILYKILHSRDKSQSIRIEFNESVNTDKLFIYMKSDIAFDRSFEIPLVDLETELLEIPQNIEYQADVTLPSAQFATIINQLKLFGDVVEFECSEEKIRLFATNEGGRMNIDIQVDDLTEFAIEENKTLFVGFNLNYLYTISLYGKLTQHIFLKIHQEFPLFIEYKLNDEGYIRFFLAPKISEN